MSSPLCIKLFIVKLIESIFVCSSGPSRRELLNKYIGYANEAESTLGKRERRLIAKPVLNLFHSEANGKLFRQQIDKLMMRDELGVGEMLQRAMQAIPDHVLDRVDGVDDMKEK
ncbi:hypothetical protein EON65_48935 [archaeon]|nr:MAG: hypothetical protein EON65_48935 [archaeon]